MKFRKQNTCSAFFTSYCTRRIFIAPCTIKCYLLAQPILKDLGMIMKIQFKVLFVAILAMPILTFADTQPQTTTVANVQAATGVMTAQAEVKNDSTTVISPRTGLRYTLGNTGGRPIILKTAAIAAVTPATIHRVVASNPALSASSQEKVKQALLATDQTMAQAQVQPQAVTQQ